MKTLYIIFYFLCFFPFIQIINFGTDVQPYALILAIIIIFCEKVIKIPKNYKYIYIVFIFSSIVAIFSFIISKDSFRVIRSLTAYLSIFIIPIVTYRGLSEYKNLKEKHIKIVINIWLVVALIQKYILSTFLYNFVSNARTTSNRGVVSLGSEPSFYGYMCIFFLILVLDFKKNKIIYIINLLFQIVFLAQSTLTIVYLFILFGILLIHNFKKISFTFLVKIISIIITSCIIINYILIKMPSSRMALLLNSILLRKGKISDDGSSMARFYSILDSISLFIKDIGFPHGFVKTRFISGYGATLYELGIIGLFLIIYITYITKKAYSKKETITFYVLIFFMMFSTVQLVLPMFSFYIGYCLYRIDKNKKI